MEVMAGVMSALVHLHAIHIVHRDIKPENAPGDRKRMKKVRRGDLMDRMSVD